MCAGSRPLEGSSSSTYELLEQASHGTQISENSSKKRLFAVARTKLELATGIMPPENSATRIRAWGGGGRYFLQQIAPPVFPVLKKFERKRLDLGDKRMEKQCPL